MARSRGYRQTSSGENCIWTTMQALRLTIPGDYWDVQIYRGWLHLWTMSGSLITLDWNRLVDGIAESATSALAVRLGFAQGTALYGDQVAPLRAEPEFREWMLRLFDSQAEQTLVLDAADIARATLDEQANPLHDLPVDTEIYERMLYAATSQGIWRSSVGRRTIHPISTRSTKLHDLPAVSMRARSRQLALAATGDGLFELGRDRETPWYDRMMQPDRMRQLSTRHCEKVDWAFSSIFASSTLSGGYLIARYWRSELEEGGDSLEDGGVFDDGTIDGSLDEPDVSWAHDEKIYTAGVRRLTSSHYTQKNVPNGIKAASSALGDIVLENAIDRPIAGGSATFGAVVEFDDRLIVVSSDENQSTIDGPVTRWRTYPRAVNYENHLHVILDDRLEVLAFYGDYLVDQREKKFGIEFRTDGPHRVRNR